MERYHYSETFEETGRQYAIALAEAHCLYSGVHGQYVLSTSAPVTTCRARLLTAKTYRLAGFRYVSVFVRGKCVVKVAVRCGL